MSNRIIVGDCIESMNEMESGSVNCCVTSPPYYGLRDYGVDGQIGLEGTPDEYIAKMVDVFREVRRVLRDDGTLWLNLGDSYASSTKGTGGPTPKQKSNHGSFYDSRRFSHDVKNKDLLGIPWRVAFALRADGWYLRQDIIWRKPNPMPESVTDRCTKAHEYMFLLSKSAKYYFDHEAISEPAKTAGDIGGFTGYQSTAANVKPSGNQIPERGKSYVRPDTRNKRSVWTVTTKPYKGAHFATFPPDLIEPCILAGCPVGGVVLDPFGGSGTTGMVAWKHGRDYILIELNPKYAELAGDRVGLSGR